MELVDFSKDRMWDKEQRRAEGRVLGAWANLQTGDFVFLDFGFPLKMEDMD